MGQDNKTVVPRFAEERWGQGVFSVADELVAEDVRRKGQPIGRAGRIDVISAIRSALPDYHTEIKDLPDYRNVFENIADGGDGVVIVRGRSECSFAALDGPAAWRAVVVGRRVDVWQVSEPASDAC